MYEEREEAAREDAEREEAAAKGWLAPLRNPGRRLLRRRRRRDMAIDAAAGAWLAGEEGRTKRCGVLVRFWFLAQGLGEDAEKTAIAIRERRREPESGERESQRGEKGWSLE